MQLYTKRTILHILYTVGYWTATCYETNVVFCDFNTVFQAVSFKNFVGKFPDSNGTCTLYVVKTEKRINTSLLY